MRKPAAAKRQSDKAYNGGQFAMATPAAAASAAEPRVHKMGPGIVCKTHTKGLPRPSNRSPAEIVVDASKGFIPLWAKDVTLRWRFQEQSMAVFQNPDAAKEGIKKLFGDALVAWGNAVPVKFTQRDDAWDFEIVMQASDDCDPNGCVLASTYFPTAGAISWFCIQSCSPRVGNKPKRCVTKSGTSSGYDTSSPTSRRLLGEVRSSERTFRSRS